MVDRFIKIYSQGKLSVVEIWVDKEALIICIAEKDIREDLRRCWIKMESRLYRLFRKVLPLSFLFSVIARAKKWHSSRLAS